MTYYQVFIESAEFKKKTLVAERLKANCTKHDVSVQIFPNVNITLLLLVVHRCLKP